MPRINISYLIALGLLGSAVASPKPIALPQTQQEIDPNPSLTYSLRDPEVTDFQTQNATTTTVSSGSEASTTASPDVTKIAGFTASNGGKYTATFIDGTMRIAGYALTVGGPEGLVGGEKVSAASGGLKHGDSTAAYATVTGHATTEVVSTSTDASGSTRVVSSSATVPVAESTGSSSASGSRSSSGSASSTASASASASGEASTGGAAAGVKARSRGAVLGLGAIAVLVCVFA